MSLNSTMGQQIPEDFEIEAASRIERAARAAAKHKLMIHRWFWKGLLAFNLILASLVFWLGIVPSYL